MRIELENAAWVLEEIGHWGKNINQDEAMKVLNPVGVTFYTIGKGKGGRVMVTKETAEELKARTWAVPPRGRRKKDAVEEVAPVGAAPPPRVVEKMVPVMDPRYKEQLEALPAWRTEVEGIVLENDARVDELYKLVAAARDVYIQLRQRVDERANMPEPPPLPPRYKRKVLIVGLDSPSVTRLREKFVDTDVVHLGGERNMPVVQSNRTLGRDYDLILCMTSYCSHPLREAAERRYGKDRIRYVKGSQSSAEAAISVWRHDRKDEDQNFVQQH